MIRPLAALVVLALAMPAYAQPDDSTPDESGDAEGEPEAPVELDPLSKYFTHIVRMRL